MKQLGYRCVQSRATLEVAGLGGHTSPDTGRLPDLMMFASRVATKGGLVHEVSTMSKGRWQVQGPQRLHRDGERNSLVHSARTYEDASWWESSAKLRMAARQLQTAFWYVRHKTLHCAISILVQRPRLSANVGNQKAIHQACSNMCRPAGRPSTGILHSTQKHFALQCPMWRYTDIDTRVRSHQLKLSTGNAQPPWQAASEVPMGIPPKAS